MAGSGRNWPIIISKHRLCPKVFPKFFCVPNPKIHENIPKKIPPPKKAFWGGGGGGGVMVLNVVFAGFDAVCVEKRHIWKKLKF